MNNLRAGLALWFEGKETEGAGFIREAVLGTRKRDAGVLARTIASRTVHQCGEAAPSETNRLLQKIPDLASFREGILGWATAIALKNLHLGLLGTLRQVARALRHEPTFEMFRACRPALFHRLVGRSTYEGLRRRFVVLNSWRRAKGKRVTE